MKTLILSTVGAVVLTAEGMHAAIQPGHADASANANPHTYVHQQTEAKDIQSFPEYSTLSQKVNLNHKRVFVATDNNNKRVIVVKENNGRQTAKSILVKKTNTLKIIDTGQGEVYVGNLNRASNQTDSNSKKPAASQKAPAKADTANQFAEYQTLADHVDLSNKQVLTATDNPNKRILLVKTDSGQAVAKSIFIKRNSHLKVIDFHKGMVNNGFVK